MSAGGDISCAGTRVSAGTDTGSCQDRGYRVSPGDIGRPVYPTDNDWGVPLLRLDMQATALEPPFARWGRETRKSRMRGTWHFYTEDYRFARLWERPSDLINSGCAQAVECNYSVHALTPRAEALWATYRKRWLARTWQEHGVRVLVDLNVDTAHADLNLLGVPRGWRAFATRGAADRVADIDRELALAGSIAGGEAFLVVYGGGKAVAARCRELGVLWVAEAQDTERGRALPVPCSEPRCQLLSGHEGLHAARGRTGDRDHFDEWGDVEGDRG